MNQPPCCPEISSEVIESLRAALCVRATAQAPPMLDPVEFGKELAQNAISEAWAWLIKGENQTKEDLVRTAHWLLTKRLLDAHRGTNRRQRTQSIQALEEDASVDSLACLTTDEPLPDEVLNRADWVSLVNQALAKLSDPDYRKIFELRFWHHMSNEQIAEALGKCVRTVPRWFNEAERAFKIALRSLTDDVL